MSHRPEWENSGYRAQRVQGTGAHTQPDIWSRPPGASPEHIRGQPQMQTERHQQRQLLPCAHTCMCECFCMVRFMLVFIFILQETKLENDTFPPANTPCSCVWGPRPAAPTVFLPEQPGHQAGLACPL